MFRIRTKRAPMVFLQSWDEKRVVDQIISWNNMTRGKAKKVWRGCVRTCVCVWGITVIVSISRCLCLHTRRGISAGDGALSVNRGSSAHFPSHVIPESKRTLQRCRAVTGCCRAAGIQFIQVEPVVMAIVIFIFHIFIIAVQLRSHIHHLKLNLPLLKESQWAHEGKQGVEKLDAHLQAWITCWDKMVTASLCLASRKLTPLTARMASPTCRPPHLSAGWLTWISEIRMGTPCSLPPWRDKHKRPKHFRGDSFKTQMLTISPIH